MRVNEKTETALTVAWKDRSGVFFFLADEDGRGLLDLVRAAGMRVERNERLDLDDPTSEVARGVVGPGLGTVPENKLLELEGGNADREYPVGEDPYWPTAQLFRQAWQAVSPAGPD